MSIISTIGQELAGLFIDDLRIAVATLAVLAAAGIARHAWHVSTPVAAGLLCGGLFAVLLENVLHAARQYARKR